MNDEEAALEALETARHRIATEGVTAAVEALIGVCRDPKAAAPAKSSAGTALLRAGGFFDRSDAPAGKEPHEMSAAELNRELRRLSRDLKPGTGSADDTGIFG